MKKTLRAILVVMACLLVFATLVSCGKSVDNIEKKAKDAGYDVTLKKFDEPVMGVVATMTIVGEGFEGATVVEYEEAEDAKKAYEDAKEALDELEEEADEDIEYVVKRSGKVLISGTADVVKKVW